MNIDLSQFTGVFFEETAEHLAEMEQLLLAIDTDTPDPDQLNSIFRAAHSIKGSAGVFGFQALSSVTHVLENLLDQLRNGKLSLQAGMVDAFLAAVDSLKALADAYRAGQEPDLVAAGRICAQLEHFQPKQPAVPARSSDDQGDETGYGFFTDPAPAATDSDPGYGFFTDPPAADPGYGFFVPISADPVAQYVDNVFHPAAAERSAVPGPSHGTSSRTAGRTDTRTDTNTNTKTSTNTNPSTSTALAQTGKKAEPLAVESSTIRVNTDKIDQIINLVGELVITQSMLAQTATEYETAHAERLQDRLNTLERNTRDLQDAVMSIRMMPVSFIFNRFPRVVRDLAAKLNKKVNLLIEGETTELDKGLIEKLADPLTHLVRNSLDHGIEPPAERLALGKPETGTIRLAAFQHSGSIVIEVSDDGGGLPRAKILAKARERQLPVSDELTDNDVWQLIFAPGFSTAEHITDVSGRGVGMDVVKRNIQEIGGRIDIQSVQGLGSTMSIRLPLTLAILDGMVVAVGSERYVIPLVFISESLQPKASDIRSITGSGQVVMVRDDYIPLAALHLHMGIAPRITVPSEGLLVVLENEGSKIALLVDELLGQQQVVVKSLESNYRRVDSIAGATIMGDGRVAMILNIEQLIRRYAIQGLTKPAITAQRGAA